jgi:hypothetical protein
MQCSNCGNIVSRGDIYCSKCKAKLIWKEGAKVKSTSYKSKSVAIILSVFLGFWSWLYTYGINKNKFWGAFAIVFICNSIINIAILLSFSNEVAEIFINYGTWIWLVILLSNGGTWIWALVDNIKKPEGFYLDYPNGPKQELVN